MKHYVCKISDLFEDLMEIMKEHGDLPVYYLDSAQGAPMTTLSIYTSTAPGQCRKKSRDKRLCVFIDVGAT